MRIATAFSGGLAACEFALKYENIDHEVIFACEWDKYARQQYLHFHDKPNTFYNDISDLNATKYKNTIDLFVLGSPCQDLSLAGKRKGFDGAKSSLFREGARVMSEMMPKTFIFENVKGLLSSNNGNDYKEVLNTFIEMGYHITTQVLNTKDYGIPQNRERVFIVGFLDHDKHLAFEFEKTTPLKLKLMDVLEDDVDEKYYLSQKMIDGFMAKTNCFKMQSLHDKESSHDSCITARCQKMAITDPYIKELILNQIGFIKTNPQGNRVYDTNMSVTLSANGGGMGAKTGLYKIKSATKDGYETATPEDSINFTHPNSKTRRGRVGKGVAQTLDCACNQGVIENYRIRKLTPKETYRLQGVKDKDIDLVVSDTQAYKISGNAISVNVMQSILRSLYKNKTQNLFGGW